MEALMMPDPSDLAMLLALPAAERIGAIARLNRSARYANHLDAIALASLLGQQPPDSSAPFPASSSPADARPGDELVLRSTCKQP